MERKTIPFIINARLSSISSVYLISFSRIITFTLFLLVTLPLWDPSLVEVGAVGYLSKPQGRFVTLFNALSTDEAAHLEIQSLPTIDRYGPTRVTWHRQDRKTITQRSVDPFAGLLNFPTISYVMMALAKIVSLNFFHLAKKCLDVIRVL